MSPCVGTRHTGELSENGWTDQDAVWGRLLWAQETLYWMGTPDPNEKSRFYGGFA